jgi:hypothetical protein
VKVAEPREGRRNVHKTHERILKGGFALQAADFLPVDFSAAGRGATVMKQASAAAEKVSERQAFII